MFADFPPSSKVMGFNACLWDYFITIYPTSVEPVNDTFLTNLCCAILAPVSPNPVIMFITPGGSPALLKS